MIKKEPKKVAEIDHETYHFSTFYRKGGFVKKRTDIFRKVPLIPFVFCWMRFCLPFWVICQTLVALFSCLFRCRFLTVLGMTVLMILGCNVVPGGPTWTPKGHPKSIKFRDRFLGPEWAENDPNLGL
jgi:hypothetical protein